MSSPERPRKEESPDDANRPLSRDNPRPVDTDRGCKKSRRRDFPVKEEDFAEKENERAAKLRSPAKGSKNFMSPTISAASKICASPKKKVLVDRNEPGRSSIMWCDGYGRGSDSIDGQEGVDLNGGDVRVDRRSLYSQHAEHFGHYYISYGALSANRIPCPPSSGRSYYTHDCYKATSPVRPYTRVMKTYDLPFGFSAAFLSEIGWLSLLGLRTMEHSIFLLNLGFTSFPRTYALDFSTKLSFNDTGWAAVPVGVLKLAPLPYNGILFPTTDTATVLWLFLD
nr:protein RALF-like 34 [Ipomoea batatas]